MTKEQRRAPTETMSSVQHNLGRAAGRTVPSSSGFSTSSANNKVRHEDPVQQPHFSPPSGAPPASAAPYSVGVGKGHRVASPSPYIGASGSNYLPPSAPAAIDYSTAVDPSAGITSDSNVLPRIDLTHALEQESTCSSPYESPRLPPRTRQGGIGSMGDITLPPLSSAVPMRRGAVSGASSGPLLPFPPMRVPYTEDDVPSRGPSPTLGRRPSFTLGHSRHVPPGPDVQLPTPALAGALERRPGVPMSGPANGSLAPDVPRSSASRPHEDGAGYYHGSQQSASVPRSVYRSEAHEEGGALSVHPSYQQSGVPPHYHRPAEEPYYGHPVHAPAASYGAPSNAGQPRFPQMYSRYTYGGEGGGGGPQMGTMLLGHPQDDHLLAMNGKRPRSAPRVLSSQPRIFACTQCPARFARNHDLKRHQRGHLSVRPYPCTWCGKSFSRKDALKRHVLVKGCGKERKGGGGGGGSDESSRKRSRSGGDDGTERSRSELDGDDDDEDDEHYMKQEVSDEEDRHDAAQAQQRMHLVHHHQPKREDLFANQSSSAADYGRAGPSSDQHGRRLSRIDPLSSEMSISRWPGNAPNPFSSIFTGSSAPQGGRLSISGLTSSFGNNASAGHMGSSLAPPSYRGTGADSILSDMSFASSRRPSAVAGGA